MDFANNAYEQLNNNHFTSLVLLDYQKVFDTVCYEILLQKLGHYDIRGLANNLIASYLSGRKQYVSSQVEKSEVITVSYGVPQGSNLGPLMFLVYINDLPNSVDCNTTLFADDTCLFVHAPDSSLLEQKTNDALVGIHTWTSANKLTVNPSKSTVLIIPPKKTTPIPHVNIVYNNNKICVQESVKYLGVVINHRLNFLKHIKSIHAKISRSVGIMYKLKIFYLLSL